MDPLQIQELFEQAVEALDRGNNVRAVAVADQLTAAVPENPAVRRIRAQALLNCDANEEAVLEARKAVDLESENEFGHRLLGLAAWRTEKLTLAQESLRRAAELSGRNPDFLAEYAWFMATERGPRLAEEAAREAVRADDASSTAWAALGLAQYRLHRRSEAEVSLRRALQLDPNDLCAQSAMVVLLQEQGNHAKAEALADLLRDHPGTEDLVEAVRDEAKQRQIARMLLEREAVQEAVLGESPRRRGLWVDLIAAVMIVGVWLLLHPGKPALFLFCVIFPLLILWRARRLLFD